MCLLVTGIFNLESAAKSKGGDKYKGEGELPLDVYIPQSFSRKEGKAPVKQLSLSFYDNLKQEGCIMLKLAKAAAKSGGDKYEGECDGTKLTLYIPQAISRVNSKPRPSLIVIISNTNNTGGGIATSSSLSSSSSSSLSLSQAEAKPEPKHEPKHDPHSSSSGPGNEPLAHGTFHLQTAAKSVGGDRYKGDSEDFISDIYIPQSFSRKDPDREPDKLVSLSFYEKPQGGDEVVMKLAKAAKSSGGDKYEGECDSSKMTMYIPQDVSRVNASPRPAVYAVITQLLAGSKIEAKPNDNTKRKTSTKNDEKVVKVRKTRITDDEDAEFE